MGTLLGNGLMKFNKFFLNIVILFELRMFVSSLFHSLMTDGKNCFEKIMFSNKQWNILRAPTWVRFIDHRDQVE